MQSVTELMSAHITNAVTNIKTWGGVIANIKEYGAIGDGLSDDMEAWERAVTAIEGAGGGVLWLPRGTYYMSGYGRLPSNTMLFAAGATVRGRIHSEGVNDVYIAPGLTVDVSAKNLNGITFRNGCNNITIEGCTILLNTGPGNENDGILFYQCGDNLRALGNVIKNCGRIGVTVDLCGANAWIENNVIEDSRNGIHVEHTDDVRIIGNKLDGCGNSSLGSNNHPYYYSLNLSNVNNIQIEGNIFSSGSSCWVLQAPCSKVRFVENFNLPAVNLENSPLGTAKYTDFILTDNFGGGVFRNNSSVETQGNWLLDGNKGMRGISLSQFTYAQIQNCEILDADISAVSTITDAKLDVIGNFDRLQFNCTLQAATVNVERNEFQSVYNAGYPDFLGVRFTGTSRVNCRNNRTRGVAGNQLFFASTLTSVVYENNVIGSAVNFSGLLVRQAPNQYRASAAPASGTFARGEVVWNTAPTAGGYVGWVCVTAGSPGTWKEFGAISP